MGEIDAKKICFVIMPFSETNSKNGLITKQNWKYLIDLIRRLLMPMGYKVIRGDTINKSGSIIKDVVSNLIQSELVIADLTGLNPNVMYEVGVRHALSNKTILLSQDVASLPFDLQDLRTIEYSLTADGPKDLRKVLKETVKEVDEAPKDDIDNPVLEFLTHNTDMPLPNVVAQIASYKKLLTPQEETQEQEQKNIDVLVKKYSSEVSVDSGDVIAGLREYEINEIAALFNVSAKARFQRKRRIMSVSEVFYIDRYPVSNALYRQFVADTGWKAPAHWRNGWFYPLITRDHPVTGVSYYDALRFLEWRSKRSGRNYRLPNEIEWEMAARKNRDINYPWGDTISAENCNCELTNADGTVPVDTFEQYPSECGIVDICGNVWEWCAPWIDDTPSLHHKGDYGVLKGGSWESTIFEVKVGYRDLFSKKDSHSSIGFRCARLKD